MLAARPSCSTSEIFNVLFLIIIAMLYVHEATPSCCIVQMPDSVDLPNRQYHLTVSAANGSMIFCKQDISFTVLSRGYLFIKTDKPIYKPSQTGTINIHVLYIYIYTNMLIFPHS